MDWYVRSGQTLYSPFYPASVTDPNALTDTETVNVTLHEIGDASLTKGNPGTIFDYLNPNLTSSSFTESGLIGGTPPFAQTLLNRLYYNAPFLNNGQSDRVQADVSVTDTASPGEPPPSPVSVSPTPVTIDIVTTPLIAGTVPNQPVAAGGTANPFSTVAITDNDFNQTAVDTATITVSDGLFTSPTDKDGLLTGSGLSQSYPGSYSIPNAVSPATLVSELQKLTFTASSDFFGVRTANMVLTVTDQPPPGIASGGYYWYPLTTWDYTTSVRETGKPISISGLSTAAQTVTDGSTIKPFASAIINDDSTNAFVSVSISEDNPANGTLSTTSLAGSVKDVTNALDAIVFTPSAANLPATTNFTINLSDGGIGENATATTSVVENPKPVEPIPGWTGTAQEGQTLTAASTDASATFQWQSLINGTWTDISGATGTTYSVAETDENNVLRVEATGSAGQVADSMATDKVIDVTPTLSVVVSGTAQEAQLLTATPTLGTDSDDSAGDVTYQWQRSADGKSWTDIPGATATTYVADEADENNVLRVAASFTDDTKQTVTNTSDATAKVTDVPPKLTVSLSGIAQQGQVLTASPALTTDSDNTTADVKYQWQRSADGSTWDNISGATASTYTLATADINDNVRAEASFTDDTGQSVSADAAIGPVSGTPHFHVADQTTGMSFDTAGEPFNGPVPGIEWQYIVPQDIITHNLNISALVPNVFIHSGSGEDAVDMNGHEGRDVLDGSTGSNFLTGDPLNAPGDAQGLYDEFYVDDRNPSAPIWTTVRNMDAPDKATIWGITQQDFAKMTEGNDVLPIAPGLDFSLVRPGQQDVNLTLSDFHTSDLPQSMGGNGRLSISFGHTPDLPGLPGSDYMQIMANS